MLLPHAHSMLLGLHASRPRSSRPGVASHRPECGEKWGCRRMHLCKEPAHVDCQGRPCEQLRAWREAWPVPRAPQGVAAMGIACVDECIAHCGQACHDAQRAQPWAHEFILRLRRWAAATAGGFAVLPAGYQEQIAAGYLAEI